MKTKIKLLLFILFLGLFLTTAKTTYARYSTSTNGEAKLNIAQWQISINNQNITNNYNTNLSFTPIIEENKNVKEGLIAPGSKGYFDIQVNPEKVDVSFSYNITLQLEVEKLIKDFKITHYAIIANNQTENEIQKNEYIGESIEGVMKYNNDQSNFKFKPFTVRIYFEWYDGQDNLMNDYEDSEINNQIINNENIDLNVLASVSFKQYNEQ